jgi:hypothetical protein
MATKQVLKKTLYSLGVVYFCFCLYSCDPVSFYKKTVKNSSLYDIMLIRYNNTIGVGGVFTIQDSILIKSKSEIVLISGSAMAAAPPCNSSNVDSLVCKIQDNNNLKVLTNLNSDAPWVRTNSGKRYHVTCRATITDADIVPK